MRLGFLKKFVNKKKQLFFEGIILAKSEAVPAFRFLTRNGGRRSSPEYNLF